MQDTAPLDVSHLQPGDCVSGDQVESSTPGLIPTYRGTPTKDRYHAGTLFVDHASHFLHFTPHTSTGSKEAIIAKHSFELLAHQHNISITPTTVSSFQKTFKIAAFSKNNE
jgi:hypothetical protein